MNSTEPLFVSDSILVNNTPDAVKAALDKADDMIATLKLGSKDALHLRLLFEETIGMLEGIVEGFDCKLWLEKYPDEYCLKVKGWTIMSADKKEELLKINPKGENSLARGTMGKISDIIENGILAYERVSQLQQKYGGGVVQFGTVGMYGNLDNLADAGIMWSLHDYQDYLEGNMEDDEAAKEAWDELEKSIVGSLTKDVKVGVKQDTFELTLIADIKEN